MFRAHHGLGVSALLLWSLAGPSLHAQSSAVPSPWSARDIGSPTPAGGSTYDQSSGTFTIDAGGSDIWGTSDKFHFVYQQVSGDVDVVARVDSITQADQWSKSGLMIRASLNANSAHAFALVSASTEKGTAFQRRRQSGGTSTNTSGPSATAPYWVRLVRAGTKVTAYVSSNGTSWTTLGSDTIALGTTAYVGIATTSHNVSSTTTAEISRVILSSSSSSSNQSALPSGQTDADVGSPAVKGSASFSNGTYTISAGGADIWDIADQFNYLYQQVTGDVDVKARVASLTNTDGWAKAGVMVRASTSANAPHASMFITPGQGYAFQRRASAGSVSDNTSGGSGTAPGWVRVKRAGSLFTAYKSTDGQNWTVVGSDSLTMGTTVFVGIAVASHNPSSAIRATVTDFAVTASGTANQPPAVTLTAPADGTSYTAPASMTLTASASDPEGKLAKVEFYRGSTLLGTDTTSPYSFTWSSVAAGTYSLTAVAYDTAGLETTSSGVTVTVGTTSNKPPTVTLTAPSGGANFTAPASISFAATASDPEGKLAKVEFYSGPTLLGTDTSSPFSYTWSSVAAGSYSLTAVAYDTAGAKATSAAVPVTVGSTTTSPPRYVVFQKSADHDTLVTSYKLNVYASGANPATATSIASVNLGKPTPNASGDIQVDELSFFTGLAAGNYVATVSAVGSGGSAQSGAITFTR
jgi:regulation of enolase protein 1 (concanavalin A-like superfamily)